MRRALSVVVAVLWLCAPMPAARAKITAPVMFVHGMGTSANDIGTKQFVRLIRELDVVEVFRYVEDAAETDGGPNDSQSSVTDNATKLASEVAAMSKEAGRPIVLMGYSMGGAIIRTYLAEHRTDAERDVDAVVLLDAVASGSWGYAFATALPQRIGGRLGDRMRELLRSVAATSASVDFDRPATTDLSPRSALFRSIASEPLPRTIDYYTFWGDIRIVVERGLLTYELPKYPLPSLGDLGLLPGDPDPTKLPELGGQRFSPPVDDGYEALDVPHRRDVRLTGDIIGRLISACGRRPTGREASCAELAKRHLDIPNTHTTMPDAMHRITVDVEEFGGQMSLLQAVLTAVGRHA